MPAPAIYVLAFVGTIGAAIAFKEFVYEPHIAPHIDRWKAEFQAARKRRARSETRAMMAELPLLRRGPVNDEPDDDDSDHSDAGSGKGKPIIRASVQPHMKNGFLIRRRNHHSETTPRQLGDVELDDWITGSSEGSQQLDLRLRKDNGPLNEPTQHMPLLPTTSPSRTSIRTSAHDSTKKPIELELKQTTSRTIETDMFLDEIDLFPQNQFNTASHVLKPIQTTPLSPIRTQTPSHILSNASSPSDSFFSTELSLSLPNETLHSKLETDVAGSPTSHPLQPAPPLPRAANAPVVPFPQSSRSPPNRVFQASNMASVAPLSPINIGSASSVAPLPLSPPPTIALSSPPPPPQLPSPAVSHASPYQTPPHLHAIPSLSQSYPLDDLLDYERGLELLSPPSPLSRTDSPFEFAGLSPRLWTGEGSTLLLARNGDRRTSRDQSSTPPSMTHSTRSAYLSFPSSPAHSVSSVSASSENGYENDSNRSEISSAFSSPSVAPARLGLGLDLGSEFLSPHDPGRLDHSMTPSSRVNGSQNHHRQQERTFGPTSTRRSVPVSPTPALRSQDFNSRRPMTTLNDNYYADTQTLSPTQSPWMMMDRVPIGSASSTLVSTQTQSSSVSAPRMSRSNSDFDSELSELDFPSMSAEEYEVSSPGRGGSGMARSGGSPVGHRSRAGVAWGMGRRDGSASDTSSWSFAGGSD